jgi:hypothetical protein
MAERVVQAAREDRGPAAVSTWRAEAQSYPTTPSSSIKQSVARVVPVETAVVEARAHKVSLEFPSLRQLELEAAEAAEV